MKSRPSGDHSVVTREEYPERGSDDFRREIGAPCGSRRRLGFFFQQTFKRATRLVDRQCENPVSVGQKKRICNLCGAHSQDGPNGGGAPDVCPVCKLRTRHRAYGALCELLGDPTENGKSLICHANPEELRYLFGKASEKFNFDVRPANFLDGTMDIQDMARIPDASQAAFVAIHVLQQVQDDSLALGEIARVLEPRGVAVFTVPFRRGVPTEPYGDPTEPFGKDVLEKYGVGTFRRYGLNDFRKVLERWFAVTVYTFVDPMTDELSSVFVGRKISKELPSFGQFSR